MAKPVISKLQSINEFLQHQEWAWQIGIESGDPDSYRAEGLPPGVEIDEETGLLSGAATLPGMYEFRVWAADGEEESAPQRFCVGIEATGRSATTDLELVWDIGINEVALDLPPALASATGAATMAAVDAIESAATAKDRRKAALAAALLHLKFGSDVTLAVRLTKWGAPISIEATQFGANFKEFEGEPFVDKMDAFILAGSSGVRTYRIYGKLDDALLQGAISNREAAYGSRAAVRCALYVVWPNPDAEADVTYPLSGTDFGGASKRMESLAFYVAVEAQQNTP